MIFKNEKVRNHELTKAFNKNTFLEMEKFVIESNNEVICRITVDSTDFLNSQAQAQIKLGLRSQ